MANPQTSVAQMIQKLQVSAQDKRQLLAIFNGLTDDIEQLRAQLAAFLAKVDTANVGGIGNTNTATFAVPKTSLNVKKS